MNLLIAHNRYAYAGGEDEAYLSEVELLRSRGHKVVTYEQNNSTIADVSRNSVVRNAFWNGEAYRSVRELLRRHRVDVMSVHNFFPLLSPSVFYAAAAEQVASVQTLHNYRLLCPGGTFLREGAVCEDCLGRALPWPAAAHGCYRGSHSQTAAAASMIFSHRLLGTWSQKVTRYLALTEFMRVKMIVGGLPSDRVKVKPNSVEDTGIGRGEGDDFLYVGRLSVEKGVDVLLHAWGILRRSAKSKRRLRIAGLGPEEMNLRAIASGWLEVQFLGQLPRHEIDKEIGRAGAVVLPSIWYEGLSRVMVEAFSKGTPVIASDLGSLAETIRNGETGFLFQVGGAEQLSTALQRFPSPGVELDRMRAAARIRYETHYSSGVVYEQLMEIYSEAIREVRATH